MNQSARRGSALGAPSKQIEYTAQRREYWDDYAVNFERWNGPRGYYQRKLIEMYRFLVPPGSRVLEIGCARGDLLAALEPAYGVGIDFSPKMIERAREKYPHLTFFVQDAHQLDAGGPFDYLILSDLVNDLWDVQRVLEVLRRHAHPGTRIGINFYSRLWEIPRRIAEKLGLARKQLPQNWLTAEDVANLLRLADFEPIRSSCEVLCPVRMPLLDTLCNRYLVRIWPFRWFGITNLMIARPAPAPPADPEPVVSVIVPARNEEGNIAQIFDRVPQMGAGTELIFVEGNSSDDTYGAIEREIARRRDPRVKLFRQRGKGKGDAVRLGFAEASGDVLMILDADLSVPPEDLPRFYQAWRSGKGEFINGVRLVYPMEDGAMRPLNFLGNKFFSLAFTWLLSQSIKDTLCGTKVLGRAQYELIAANRAYFGEIDPFGDFDLIFGAAKYHLKFVDLPVRYRERVYGETNIRRWRHGWLLLRMAALAMRRIKFV
ncbi:MAG TPA: bifunctional class I SAM-dependent methyltransferase/glycosyltransferase family 2 protein [Bryobacteraceae bacterium]|jgi:SAM-dependent methyltransferase|nr:bifunctional class I SAM-dependent methyltransferase/glycosyltransferase family 2 protein [Bryobacteraceae bacterium]